MKNIILVLISVLAINVQAQETADEDLSSCVNAEFARMSQAAVQGLFTAEIGEAMRAANVRTQAEQEAVAKEFMPLMKAKLQEARAPYVSESVRADGRTMVEVTDKDIFSAFAAICDALGEVSSVGQPTLDKESIIYKTLVKERTEIEASVKPQLDEIKSIQDTIAELNQKIIDIQKGIAPEITKIAKLDKYVQEELVIPGKTQEEIQAAIQAALKSPEIMALMKDVTDILGEKLSESNGEEISLGVKKDAEKKGPSTESTPEVEEEDDFDGLVFKD